MSSLTHLNVNDGGDGGDGAGGGGSIDVVMAAMMAAADIALIVDADQRITHVSLSFTAMTGYEPEDLLGLNCRVLQGPGTDPATRRRMREVIASGEAFEGQVLNYRKDGSAFWIALRIVPVRTGAGREITHFVSVQRDITNKVAMVQQLQNQALHDDVTGLPNRIAAEQTIDDAIRGYADRSVTTAIGLIDLDDFRVVNNSLGHDAGDAVLQQWATRVLARLCEGDLLARMGGDEFVLILRNINRDASDKGLSELLDRLHEAVEEPFLIEGQELRIGMSMGVALVPEDGTDRRSMLRIADEALYRAKRRAPHTNDAWWEAASHIWTEDSTANGSGHESDRHSGREGTGLGAENYRGALVSGGIAVYYQPVVDLQDGSVTLFEALAGLKLPGGRVAPPDEFLPHLTATELRTLFAGVLEQALDFIARWDGRGVRPNVSVNLPPEILHDRTVPPLVARLLHRYDIEPGGLGLELLESMTMSLEAQRSALQELAGLGVRLAMDDLGSGYSSLQRLSSFPFSAIKLDRGLFQQVGDRPLETLSVMATLLQMGRDLGMTVVVEGLEDQCLTEAAIILGAPLGQGYYLARPMAAENCLPWFDSFDLELHRSPIHTFLGALAYHWQFARLAAPHPLELTICPLTRFLAGNAAPPEVTAWHARQHSPQGMHPASSRLLTRWFTDHIRERSQPT
ncbi:bifunctional diguanylate cyclase/phosphodiesterase [Arthrobacter sp. B0490]|uniref:putative bifunctional diguanylate cyclase/phosphodiesterase n=1 Tax=Arthrobacter sp. B0490 TaxID=2058891 RepID=UPI000CE2D0D3|nr:EAL domain-containing protein [Arthrobacter sp. B0490]